MRGASVQLFAIARAPRGDLPVALLIQALGAATPRPDPRLLAIVEQLTTVPGPDGQAAAARLFARLPPALRRQVARIALRLARRASKRVAGPAI